MSRRREILVVCAALAACTRSEGRSADAGARVDALADAGAFADAGALADAGTEAGPDATALAAPPPDADAEAFTSPAPTRSKSIGHTSVVFKTELSNGKKAVFKASFRKGPLRYKGEIAAYRLGRALGIDNVPPAYFRVMTEGALGASLDVAGREVLARDVLAPRGEIRGAVIPWIDDLGFLALEAEPLWTQWRRWLRRGEKVDDAELARQVTVLCAFDWLTGNWDRWSGGNVGLDKASGKVLFIDNDGAFFETPPKKHLDRQWKLLVEIDRLSRGFVARVRGLRRDDLVRALGEEIPGVPLLSDAAVAGVVQRRDALVALWDEKIGDAGDAEALYFP